MSKACQNQGFIIDGFPKTIDQAKTLFERKIFKKKKEISNFFKLNLIKRMTQQKKKAAKKGKMKAKKQNSIN